jgi:antitoxin component YwqK of YwqJK toxin-antitoxin module
MKKFVLSAATVLLTLCANAKLAKIDLGDTETLDKIIAEAIDSEKLQKRGEEGEELRYAPDQNTLYTGWSKEMHDNGQMNLLYQYKDGKRDGLVTRWYSNGQKMGEGNFKAGKLMTAVGWMPNGEKSETDVVKGNGVVVDYNENGTEKSRYIFKDGKMDGLITGWSENGQKSSEITYKDGTKDGLLTKWYGNGQKMAELNYKDGKEDGLTTLWYENGKKKAEGTYKDDKLMTAVAWKPNGEKCPETNLVDGNGILVGYGEDGTEDWRVTYKDGEKVYP